MTNDDKTYWGTGLGRQIGITLADNFAGVWGRKYNFNCLTKDPSQQCQIMVFTPKLL